MPSFGPRLKLLARIERDLSSQLLAIYMLLIIPFLVGLFIITRVTGDRVRREVEATDLSLARAVAQSTDISISNALNAVELLSKYPAVIEADQESMQELFRVIMSGRPDIELIYRMDPDGVMLYYFPPGPRSTMGREYSYRDYYKDSRTQISPFISEGRISPISGQPVATAVMPIWTDDNEYLGVVGTNIKLQNLSDTLTRIVASQRAEEGFQVVILDSRAQIIAYHDPDFLLDHATELVPYVYGPALSGDTGNVIAENRRGEARIYTYVPIPSGGWVSLVSRPTASAFATENNINYVVIGSTVAFLLAGLLFWQMLARRVIQPVEKLANLSEAIGQGTSRPAQRPELDPLSRRRDQIGHLIRSILRMEQNINARMTEQAMLLETSTAVVSSLDPQTVLARILEQVDILLGVSKSAIVALDEERGVFRIRAGRGLSEGYIQEITIQPNDPLSVTMRALRSKNPVQISDTENDLTYVPQSLRSREEGFRSILTVPLNTIHSPPAALILYRPDPHLYTENEIDLVVNFANHAAMAIENAILYARSDMRLREQTHRLESLVQSLSDGLVLGDLHGNVLYANRRVSDLTGLDLADLPEVSVDQVVERIIAQSANPDEARISVSQVWKDARRHTAEIPLTLLGQTLFLRFQSFEVIDSGKTPIGRGLILQDVTADRELDRMRSSLVSTVSHELRTPLASIKGYATTLLAEDVEWDRASQMEFLTVISNESDRLSNLVNTLLDLSKIEAGSLRLSKLECRIEEVIQNAARGAPLGPWNHLEVQIEPGLSSVYADPPRLETILRNLIENSVKYAGEQASIRVDVARLDGAVQFTVTDDGPGIPQDERRHIFESFYRVENDLTRVAGGAGLGLAICQGLVRAHGGEIWVQPSESGNRIAFTIPMNTKTPRQRKPAGKG